MDVSVSKNQKMCCNLIKLYSKLTGRKKLPLLRYDILLMLRTICYLYAIFFCRDAHGRREWRVYVKNIPDVILSLPASEFSISRRMREGAIQSQKEELAGSARPAMRAIANAQYLEQERRQGREGPMHHFQDEVLNNPIDQRQGYVFMDKNRLAQNFRNVLGHFTMGFIDHAAQIVPMMQQIRDTSKQVLVDVMQMDTGLGLRLDENISLNSLPKERKKEICEQTVTELDRCFLKMRTAQREKFSSKLLWLNQCKNDKTKTMQERVSYTHEYAACVAEQKQSVLDMIDAFFRTMEAADPLLVIKRVAAPEVEDDVKNGVTKFKTMHRILKRSVGKYETSYDFPLDRLARIAEAVNEFMAREFGVNNPIRLPHMVRCGQTYDRIENIRNTAVETVEHIGRMAENPAFTSVDMAALCSGMNEKTSVTPVAKNM